MIWNKQLDPQDVIDLYNGDLYPARIFILAGQSNMCGRGIIQTGVDDSYSLLYNRVSQFGITNNMNSDGTLKANVVLTPATNPLDWADIFPGEGSTGTEPNTCSLFRTFCEDLIKSNVMLPRERIILLPMAKGATGFFTEQWNKTDNKFYTALITAYNALINSLKSDYTFGGMFWIQGESDSSTSDLYTSYLKQFYSDLIIDIPALLTSCFIMGEINNTSSQKANLNNILNSFADGKNRFIVHSSGLPTNVGDTTHYNTVAQREIGKMFCLEYLNFVSGVNINKQSNIQYRP
jgi:hypothetical protein